MCIIAAKPADLVLDDQIIRNMWYANNDGAGFMYAEDGVLHVQKGFMTLESFQEAYEPHAEKKMVMHFRIKTHGETNAVNTHPFLVDDNLAFVHNGVITGFGSKDFSDTYHFNKELIQPLRKQYKSFLSSQPIHKLLSDRIGYSKLVFMNNKGEHVIINEEKGEYSSDGVWFSNSSWKREAPKYLDWKQEDFEAFGEIPQKKTSYQKPGSLVARGTGSGAKGTGIFGGPKRRTFELNSIVWINQDYQGIRKGTVGKITWFTQGHAIAVDFQGEDASIIIPSFYLEIATPLKIVKRVGHLKPGDYLLYDYVDDNMTHALDPINHKWYFIPNDSYEVIDDDEHAINCSIYNNCEWAYDLIPAELM